MKLLLSALMVLILSAPTAAAATAGFQRVTVPDSDDKPRQVGIWYPSDAPASPQQLGPHLQTVAPDGAIVGRRLPLVVILPGDQSSFVNHYETALALVEAGFVVTGVDQDMDLVERPRHVRRVLDYMLTDWSQRDRLDPERIGIFGFSVGGFTALVTVGGLPDLTRVASYCAEHPDRVCSVLKSRHVNTTVPANAWVHDGRIKAAVVAAPTLGFTFGRDALAPIQVPIQLWRAADDEITPHPWAAEAIRRALPTSPDYVVVPNAGHFAFVSCSAELAKRAPVMCRDAPAFDRAVFHATFNRALTTFFRAHLPTR